MSHPTLQELVLHKEDCAVAENARPLEPIDPDEEDVAMEQSEEAPPTSDTAPAENPAEDSTTSEFPTNKPIPLLPQELWHRRLGHLNERDMLRLHNLAQGIPKLQPLDHGAVRKPCATCAKGK